MTGLLDFLGSSLAPRHCMIRLRTCVASSEARAQLLSSALCFNQPVILLPSNIFMGFLSENYRGAGKFNLRITRQLSKLRIRLIEFLNFRITRTDEGAAENERRV